jgi:hypothetical protein
LVEQAIARLRSQAAAAQAKMPDSVPKPVAPGPIVDLPTDPAKAAKRMTLDLGTLRAFGYLPEVGNEQQFAERYRRIKRPLIDKALSGTVTVGDI